MCTFTGKIVVLPSIKTKSVCKCDGCGEIVNTSFGDPREKVFKISPEGKKYDIKMLCFYCVDEIFGNHEPYSIFS